jgi:hypothetical protein
MQIYLYITFYYREHFPFYKLNDARWKNSVRHTLTVSPHFHKGGKVPHRAGHLWTVANRHESFQKTLVRIFHIFIFTFNLYLEIFHAGRLEKYSKIIWALRRNYYTDLITKCILVQDFVS